MKILHCADTHTDPSNWDNGEQGLAQILELARAERPDAIVHCGDLIVRRGHLVPWIAAAVREWFCALSEVAPVVVVAGNHDMSHVWGEVGALGGILSNAAETHPIFLAERPEVFEVAGLQIACLPYPSKYSLRAQRPEIEAAQVNHELSILLEDCVRGLGAEVEQRPGRSILVYHGSIRGAKTSTEQNMTTDVDIVLSESAIPKRFQAVLCGHIHRFQNPGRTVYAGSPWPLDFGEAVHPHGVVIWDDSLAETDVEGPVRQTLMPYRFVELEPKHRLITLDWREKAVGENWRLGWAFGGWQSPEHDVDLIFGARVRVLLTFARGVDVGEATSGLIENLKCDGAHEVRVQVEREAEDRAAEAGVRLQADASLPSLLDLYAKRNPDAAPVLDQLKAFGAEVDGVLPPEARALERVASYRLLRIAWKAWKSLEGGEVPVDELGGLVVVEGENASGKSNLIEIESFALWGKLPRGKQGLGELVHIGDRECWVEVDIEMGFLSYRVRRSVKVNAKGDGASDLQVLRHRPGEALIGAPRGNDDGTWEPANLGTVRETQAWLEERVGPYELYLATRYASQGDIDRLIELSPAERTETLQAALGMRVFDYREAEAKKRFAKLVQDGATIQAVATALEAQIQDRPGIERTFAECAAVAETATDCLGIATRVAAKAEQDRELAQQAHQDAAKTATERRRRADRIREIEQAGRVLAEERARLETEAQAGKGAAELIDQHERRVDRVGKLTDADSKLDAARERLKQRTEILNETRGVREREVLQAQNALENIARASTAAEVYRTDTATRHANERTDESERGTKTLEGLNARLSDLRSLAGKINVAPFGEKCAEAKCELLQLPIEARGRLPDIEQELADAVRDNEKRKEAIAERQDAEIKDVDQQLVELQHARAAADKRLSEAKTAAADAMLVLEEQVRAAQSDLANLALTSDVVELTNLRAAIGAFPLERMRADSTAGHRAAGRLDGLARELDALANESATLVQELMAMPEVDVSAAFTAFEKATAEQNAAREERERWRQTEVNAKVDLARAEEQLRAVTAAAEQLEAKRLEVGLVRGQIAIAGIFVRAMGRDGVPYLMLERAIPALEQHGNFFLEPFDLRVEVEPLRDLRSGEQKSEVHVRYRDRFGLHGLAAASGQQRVVLGFALRFALAQIQAEAHGLKVSHILIDEGFSSADETQILGMQQMVRRFADRFGRVFVISHSDEIKELGDSRFRVCPNGSAGAIVERVS